MKYLISKTKSYFPKNWLSWKNYFKVALPVMLSSLIFALNSFVDNFMSIQIEGGNQALAYANAWTEIQIGIISATTIVGTSLFSQYLGKKDWNRVKEVMNLRILFAMFMCLCISLPCLIVPETMIRVISAGDNISLNILEKSSAYLRIITISWLLNTWAFVLVMILREKQHGFISLMSSINCVVINVVLNSIFIWVLNLGIEWLAISTVISLIVDNIFLTWWSYKKDYRIFVDPLKVFNVSFHVFKQFYKRLWSFILLSAGSIIINIRFIFWSKGYGTGSIGTPELRLSSATILGITGMFFNIFWTTFESFSSTVAVYVGTELGKNNIEQAKNNSKELQGFHISLGIAITILAICFCFILEHISFFADGHEKELRNYYQNESHKIEMNNQDIEIIVTQARKVFLSGIKNTLLAVSVFIPVFVWFVSRERIVSVGGLTNQVSLLETILGLFQLAWLSLICFVFVNYNISFSWAYFIFFLSDLPKLVVYEIFYFKVNWARNVTTDDDV